MIFGTHNIYKFAELVVSGFVGPYGHRHLERYRQDRGGFAHRAKNILSTRVISCLAATISAATVLFPTRGRERTGIPGILSEIERLVADGVVEVMLLGQNVNLWKNLEEPMTFAQLLSGKWKNQGIEGIRFMTSHPKDLSDELIEVMKTAKICRYIHLPLQSGSSRILKLMNRRYDKERYLELVRKIREAMPDISLTTDIIVGFPGETEEDFLETMDVVEKVRYDSAFTFIYSKRTGTPAAVMEDQVPEEVLKDRFDRLVKKVQEIGREMSSRDKGTVQEVLVEEQNSQDPQLVTGRLSNNLLVHFPGDPSLIGQLCQVELLECRGFYYMGRKVG